ncbi:tetratricopeptide repeat protein [bacterium]|nr:tetratricopeptide repeat protein [bacterium]
MLNITAEQSQGMTKEILLNPVETLENARAAHEKYLLKGQNEDLLEAVNQYLLTLKSNPNISESYYRLASLMLESGEIDLENAIEQCKAAISVAPKNSDAHLYTAYFMEKAGDFTSSSKEYEKAVKFAGLKSARARLLYSSSILSQIDSKNLSIIKLHKFLYHLISGVVLSAIDKKSLKMLFKNIKDNAAVALYKTIGTMLEGVNGFRATLKVYKKAVEKTGHKGSFYSRMGDILMRKEEYTDALDCYKKAYITQPNDRKNLLKLATITRTYMPNAIDEAIDYYTALLNFGKDTPQIYYELGHLYLKKGDNFHALVAFKLALDSDNNNPYFNNAIAFAYLRSNMFDDAIQHYQKAIKINPDDKWTALVCHTLGLVYLDMKMDFQSALSAFQAGLVLDENNYELHVSLADIYMAQNDLDNAIQTYCDAIKVNGNCFLAYAKLGLALWENNCIEEALVAYNKAIELNPDCDTAYNNLGVVYIDGLADNKEALNCFLKAIELNPNYTLAYFNAGRAYEKLGLAQDAASYYQMAIDLNRLSPELIEDEIQDKIYSLFNL